MGDKRPYKPRKPGAGRKPLKPNYDAAAILQEQMEAAVALYTNNSLQTIADTLSLNPIVINAEGLSILARSSRRSLLPHRPVH